MPDAAQQMLDRVRIAFDAYLNPTGDIRVEDVPFIDLGDEDRRERQATDGTTVREPSLPQYVLERFTQSLARFRNDLNPGLEDIPTLDLTEDHDPEGLQFWGEDGSRLNRFMSGEEDDDEEDESDSSDDESEHEDDMDDEDEDERGSRRRGAEWELPGHR